MPGDIRRKNQIAGLHDALLAVDRGVGAAALNNESQRRRRMPVRPRVFAGLDVLERDLDRVRGKSVFTIQSRIHQPHHAPLAVLQADHIAGAHQAVVDILPLPQTRLDCRHRMIRQTLPCRAASSRKDFSPPCPGRAVRHCLSRRLVHRHAPQFFSSPRISQRANYTRNFFPFIWVLYGYISQSESSPLNNWNGLNNWNDWNGYSPLSSRRDRFVVDHIDPHRLVRGHEAVLVFVAAVMRRF